MGIERVICISIVLVASKQHATPRILDPRTGNFYSTLTNNTTKLTAVGSRFNIGADNCDDPDMVDGGEYLCDMMNCQEYSIPNAQMMYGFVIDVVPLTAQLDGTSHEVLASREVIPRSVNTLCHYVHAKVACHATENSVHEVMTRVEDGSHRVLHMVCHPLELDTQEIFCHALFPGDMVFSRSVVKVNDNRQLVEFAHKLGTLPWYRFRSMRVGNLYSTFTMDDSMLTTVGNAFEIGVDGNDDPSMFFGGELAFRQLCDSADVYCETSLPSVVAFLGLLLDVAPPTGKLDNTNHTILRSTVLVQMSHLVLCHAIRGKYVCHNSESSVHKIQTWVHDGTNRTLRAACHARAGCHILFPGDAVLQPHVLV